LGCLRVRSLVRRAPPRNPGSVSGTAQSRRRRANSLAYRVVWVRADSLAHWYRGEPQVRSDLGDLDVVEVDRLGDGVHARVEERGGCGTEELRRHVPDDLVDEPRGQEAAGEARPALQQGGPDAAAVEAREQRTQVDPSVRTRPDLRGGDHPGGRGA